MSTVFVDTSCVAALALSEPAAEDMRTRLARFGDLLASNLLEAELRATLRRERVATGDGVTALLATITWITPNRPLSAEIATVLHAGYVRGADCWHLATALYYSPDPSELTFLTLDERQHEVARALGFRT